MSLIRNAQKLTERFIHTTWLETVSRRGTFFWIRRDHEITGNFARTLASEASSAPALRTANLTHVRERFDATARGTEHALYKPLQSAGVGESLVVELRQRRARIDELLRALETSSTESDGFLGKAEDLARELDDFFRREEEALFPVAIERMADADFNELEPRYRTADGEAVRLSA